MTEQEVKLLISQGESQFVEFKREDENNKDFAKAFVGFANSSKGGKILIGIDDSGTIVGINQSNRDELMLRLNNIAFNNCKPPVSIFIDIININAQEVLIVNVPSGLQKPYKLEGRTYIRSNNQTREASREEEMRLYQSSQSIFFDEIPISFSTINDLDLNSFEQFLNEYLEISSNNEDIKNYLKNFHIITIDQIPTVTGILFFGKSPQNFIPYAYTVCAAYNDTDIAAEPFDKKEIKGTIPSMIKQIETFLQIHLRNQHKIKNFEPENDFELPMTALRELIINAIAHRDYTITAPIRIFIFSDRLEIHSPGLLPNTVTIESIKVGGSHVLRNPTIYNLLGKYKMVTDIGSGVRRAITLIKKKINNEPILEQTENEFVIKIFRK